MIVSEPAAEPDFVPPSVGIFWQVANVLVTNCSTLEQAEVFGDCITHARGHYECWQEWQALGGTRLAAKDTLLKSRRQNMTNGHVAGSYMKSRPVASFYMPTVTCKVRRSSRH
jgi:hypothetical protein